MEGLDLWCFRQEGYLHVSNHIDTSLSLSFSSHTFSFPIPSANISVEDSPDKVDAEHANSNVPAVSIH